MQFRLFALTVLLSGVLHAQSFTPKAIHVNGVPEADRAAVLDAAGLEPGVPITKAGIEAALQKLADTGNYTDLSYNTDASGLTLTLTQSPGSVARRVHYANFVWWTDAELEAMVEARVPLFHGELSPNTPQVGAVTRALVAIAAAKGLTILVDTVESKDGLVFMIAKPEILSGNLSVPNVTPIEGETIDAFKQGLAGQEFNELETPDTIVYDTAHIFANAGYLHATVGRPLFSPPRADGTRFLIDAAVTVDPGALYRVGTVDIHGADAHTLPEFTRMVKVHAGDPASPLRAQLTTTGLKFALEREGYLDAAIDTERHEDAAAHTVSYAIHATPGAVYHLARISVEATLPATLGEALQRDKRLLAGVVAGSAVEAAATQILTAQHALELASFELVPDRQDHTATLVVRARHRPAS
jgi:outer membrane protein assembly factor BamA